nr:hypothetical protein [Tanacetum cinerariifolium]
MEHVAIEAAYRELDDRLVRAATTASSLEVEQDSVNDQDDAEMFDINDLHGEEVFVEKEVADKEVNDKEVNDEVQKVIEEVVEDINTAKLIVDAAHVSSAGEVNAISIATTISDVAIITTKEITLAQALVEIKTTKPKAKGIVLQEPSETITRTTISLNKSQDKGKGRTKTCKRESSKKPEANIALIETWDDVQAKIDADYQMAERLQVEEQKELTNEEKATLFMQLLEKRKKFFVAERTEDKRNKPPTQAQQRKIMCTYLKNVEGKKFKNLKNKSFNSIQNMFDRAFKRVNTFVDFRTELVKAVMSPRIVDWKIHKEEKKSYYQIIRADEKYLIYMFFRQMLKRFDKEDLEDLYKLVKDKYGSTRPVEDLNLLLWGDLKTMFEPHVEDVV